MFFLFRLLANREVLFAFLFLVILLYCVRRYFFRGPRFVEDKSCAGKVYVVTGVTEPTGRLLVKALLSRGAKVYMGCKTIEDGKWIVESFVEEGFHKNKMVPLQWDASSMRICNEFIDKIMQHENVIDGIVHNDSVVNWPTFLLTEDNNEYTWQANVLVQVLLTERLMPLLEKSTSARVLLVSSRVNRLVKRFNLKKINIDSEANYQPLNTHAESRFAQVLYAVGRARSLRNENTVTLNVCNPGVTFDQMLHHLPLISALPVKYTLYPLLWYISKTEEDAIQTPLYCMLSSDIEGITGCYFSDMQVKGLSDAVVNYDLQDELVAYCMLKCGFKQNFDRKWTYTPKESN